MDAIKEGMLASAKAAEAAARIGERLFCQNTPNVMTFNSQICTSREQSERLLALGLKKETADMMWANCMGNSSGTTYYLAVGTPYYDCDIPAWSLHRLLSLYNLHYIEFMNDEEIESVYDIVIDAIEQAIKEGYFNKEYLENEMGEKA